MPGFKRKIQAVYEDTAGPLFEYIEEKNPELKLANKIAGNMYKRYTKTKQVPKYRSLKRKSYARRGVSGRVLNVVRSQAHGPEVKRVDIHESSGWTLVTPISTTSYIIPLNLLAVGSQDYQRTGSKVQGVGLHIKGYIYNSAQTNANILPEDLARFVVVYDRQPNGVAPVYSDVFTSLDQSGNTSAQYPWNLRSDRTYDRFVILRDELRMLPALNVNGATAITETIAQPGSERIIDWYIKLKGLTTEYLNGNLTADALSSGGIFLMIRSATVILSKAQWYFVGNTRYMFTDL